MTKEEDAQNDKKGVQLTKFEIKKQRLQTSIIRTGIFQRITPLPLPRYGKKEKQTWQ